MGGVQQNILGGKYAEEKTAALEHQSQTRWTDELLNVTLFVLTGVFSEDSRRVDKTAW